jgi:hypothetical protein
MVELATTIWADGPSSDPYEPDKAQIREWGTWVEGIITAFTSGAGNILKTTRAALFADLAHAADTTAWVLGDPTVGYNGIYVKSGASGAGSWTRVSDLPFSFIIANDAGAGTPNAIQATTAIPVSGSALIWMNVADTNTGTPVTVSFNGGSALTIKTNSGNDVVAGGLTAGMIVMGIVSGSTFWLVSDQASTAILAAAEAAADRAEAAATALETIDQRIIVISDDSNRVTYPDFASLVVGGDWAPAFNAAMAARRFVDVPPGDYPLKSQAVFQQDGQILRGIGAPRPLAKVSGASPRIIYDAALGTTPWLHMKYTGHLNRLAFLGPAKGTGNAVLARRPTDSGLSYEDTDVDISECTFYDLADAVQHWNRGINFKDNSVALCTVGVRLEGFDSANFVDDAGNPFDNLPFGFRAIRVDGNRFHAVDVATNNTGLNAEQLRAFSLQANLLDIGTMLFNGGLMSGVIKGNEIDNFNGTTGAIRFTTAISDLTLGGNLINGRSDSLPGNLIIFQQAVTSLTMQGNTLRGCTGNAVSFNAAVTNSTIGLNSIAAVGGTATQAAILFGAAVTDTTVCANAFNQNAPAYAVRGQSGATWTRVTVQNNSRNNAANGYGIFTDGGGNSIQAS